MKFLVDECLSPDLVTAARQAGHDATHIVHLGKAGWKDWNVIDLAVSEERVLVTNNAGDFWRLYARQQLHPGLVIIIPAVGKALQRELFQAALAVLDDLAHLTNKVLEVTIDGADVVTTLYDLPDG